MNALVTSKLFYNTLLAQKISLEHQFVLYFIIFSHSELFININTIVVVVVIIIELLMSEFKCFTFKGPLIVFFFNTIKY